MDVDAVKESRKSASSSVRPMTTPSRISGFVGAERIGVDRGGTGGMTEGVVTVRGEHRTVKRGRSVSQVTKGVQGLAEVARLAIHRG